MQLLTIILTRGDMYVLGEAYAFGVVWSFVFKALAMIVLRFKDRSPREFKVPLNLHIGGVEIPFGLIMLFLVLLFTALLNLLTKEVATIGGSAFTAVFLAVFMISERIHEKRLRRRASQARRAIQPDDGRGDQSPGLESRQALSQAGGDPFHATISSCWRRPWRKPTRKPPTWP